MVTPIEPSLLTDFSDSVWYVRDNFTLFTYSYDLGGRSWIAGTDDAAFDLAAKILIGGIIWLGGVDLCKFVSPDSVDRGDILSLAEIEADATDGNVRYALKYTTNGESAGTFVAYWNTTQYDNSSEAWLDDGLYLLHGVGLESTATANIGALLVSLLFLQLPDVPLLVNILIAVPIWAAIVYVLWYIIKEMIPFV